MALGERVPEVVFKLRVRDESLGGPNPFHWRDVTTQEIFAGKKVALFAVPGAFTPTCSSRRWPCYEELYDEFRALGIDEVICLSVNDAFVMNQWGHKVFLLPDGSRELARKDNFGFGMRSWRYAMYVNDGVTFSDDCPLDPLEVSDADTMLSPVLR
ncbi:MAG: redoxin family protein [Gloeomargarita sp. SKYBB_i_bin120]|nr:redoxin family protein [Gloeomargarita sp. SKYG98]MCS7293686.1 redoxin family protein [Gloeomargarita sp. SKYB120]MDW8179252.1 redoxin family protein [Gloeomargarita sp. SKYBB_i_bin120]